MVDTIRQTPALSLVAELNSLPVELEDDPVELEEPVLAVLPAVDDVELG
jgi:hypothetical protein